jgi:hypothetical protein
MEGAPTTVKQRLAAAFTPGVRVLLAVLMLIIGLALAGGSYLESQETREIALNGVRTTADVVEAYEIRQDLRTISIDETIRFKIADGTQVEETITDCGDRKPELPGSQVQVKYARADPSMVQFAEPACQKVSDPTGFIRAGMVALAAGLLLLWSAWRARRRPAPAPV